jgi:hypothetical protein
MSALRRASVGARRQTKYTLGCLRLMPKINAEIPESLSVVLDKEVARTKTDTSSIITAPLTKDIWLPTKCAARI